LLPIAMVYGRVHEPLVSIALISSLRSAQRDLQDF
jgi:hypothetical protein